jgi:Tol biopolymer transport system component
MSRRGMIQAVVAPVMGLVVIAVMGLSEAPARAVFPGGNGRIAFVRAGGIFSSNADGSNQSRIMPRAWKAAWSPDGTKIAFQRRRLHVPHDTRWDIYVANADGSRVIRLTRHGRVNSDPSFSADGKYVLYSRQKLCRVGHCAVDLYEVRANGKGKPIQLTDTHHFDERDPAMAADGSLVVFSGSISGDSEIFVMSPDGSHRTRLTRNDKQDTDPSWSPDSAQILFNRLMHGTFSDEVFVMDADGSNQTRLTVHEGEDYADSFSPDGTKVLLARCCFGSHSETDLATMDVNGTNFAVVIPNAGDAGDWQAVAP